ncbi:hypothetical protein JCM11491_000712 [Sporobolomyces phaffii]
MSDRSFSMTRTSSMCSLPSPPADSGMDLDHAREEHDVTKVSPRHAGPSRGLIRASRRSCVHQAASDDDEEVDQLESEDEPATDRDGPPSKKRPTSQRRPALALGSPVNVSITTSSRASRKQLLNPFFLAADASSSSSSSSTARPPAPFSASPERPASNTSTMVSPTRHSRRRIDPDRMRPSNITPPQKTRAQLQDERLRAEAEEAQALKRKQMGWDDPDNPFLDKDDAMFKRNQTKGELKRPETLTYVKRGERIRTSIPFTAVLTSSSPSEDPFTYTTPRLLFPPAPPKIPTTPPSSFLQALRASTSTSTAAASAGTAAPVVAVNKPLGGGGGPSAATELPPTPVTLKRKPSARALLADDRDPASSSSAAAAGAGPGPYKKLKLPASEAQHQQHQRSLQQHQLQHRNGLRQ